MYDRKRYRLIWLGMTVGTWLLFLPWQLRAHSLSALLARCTADRGRTPATLEPRQVVRVVSRLCRLRLFRLPVFPRHCLLQSLALYRTCRRFGFPAALHIGVLENEGELHAHSWITLAGRAVAETCDPGAFRTIYTHGPGSSG